MQRNYKDLKVWQKSFQICLQVYQMTPDFPKETHGLRSQLRRSAVSVPSNIAEGYGRKTTPESLRSLCIACGSYCGLETQLSLSGDLKYIKPGQFNKLQNDIGEVERILEAPINSLERKHSTP